MVLTLSRRRTRSADPFRRQFAFEYSRLREAVRSFGGKVTDDVDDTESVPRKFVVRLAVKRTLHP